MHSLNIKTNYTRPLVYVSCQRAVRLVRRHVHQVGDDHDLQSDAALRQGPRYGDRGQQFLHQPVLHQGPRGGQCRRRVRVRRRAGPRSGREIRSR